MKARHMRKDSGAGMRVRASDMPMLRELRVGLRRMLGIAKEIQQEETTPHGRLAAAVVVSKVQQWYDDAGRRLDLLESTPPGWRP